MGDATAFSTMAARSIVANASAHGEVIAYANAWRPGVVQRVWSGVASADGNSGSVSVVAHAGKRKNQFGSCPCGERVRVPRPTGIDQAAANFPSGTVSIGAAAEAGPGVGTPMRSSPRTRRRRSRQRWRAIATFDNSGALAVGATVLAEGEFAMATAAMLRHRPAGHGSRRICGRLFRNRAS
jgi:hypothetical protein